MEQWLDLSHTIQTGMPVYPGDSEVVLEQTGLLAEDGFVGHRLHLSSHAGTHMDMPMHMIDDSRFIAELPLSRVMGRACLLDVRGRTEIGWNSEYRSKIENCEIVLLWTGWDRFFRSKRYFDHPTVTAEFAREAAAAGMKLLAVDMLSPDRHPFPIHHFLFAQDILLVENATGFEQLSAAAEIFVIALPLKLRAEGSPVRMIASCSSSGDRAR